jgi:hypothetical protein
MKRLVALSLVVAVLGAGVPSAHAGVNVERRSDENAMVEIARSTIYGAFAGTLVGSAIALVADAHGTPVKWGFVVGTFVGAGYGLYSVQARPQPSALLEVRDGRIGTGALAALQGAPGDAQVRLLAIRF